MASVPMMTSANAMIHAMPPVAVVDVENAEAQVAAREKLMDDLRVIIGRLAKLAEDQVRLKAETEKRWLRALRMFHGRYDPEVEAKLRDAKKSRAYIKVTRKKTNSWKGRLESLIFPTDDRNYGIQPTPVPSLTNESRNTVEKALAMVEQANEQQQQADAAAAAGDAEGAQVSASAAATHADRAQEHADRATEIAAEIKEAKKRAGLMQDVMDDQLTECSYAAEGRDAILDLCRLGTAIMKGPMASEATRGKWTPIKHPDVYPPGDPKAGQPHPEAGRPVDGQFVYSREADPKPVYKRVDPWSYFPDMSARKKGEEEFEFERHLWTKKDLRRLVRENGFDAAAVRRLLNDERTGRTLTDVGMSYLADLREINGDTELLSGRFVGWEYHGPLECEEIVTMLHAMGDTEGAVRLMETADPLVEMKVICYFCDTELLKIAPEYPLDSQESLYSVVPFESAEASMFGYGVPDITEDSVAALNAAWRMCLDNAALSTGPQVIVNRDYLIPANGSWDLTPRKIWYKTQPSDKGAAFETYDIASNVNELMAIVNAAKAFIDDESAMPVQSEGEGTESPNQTATAANIMALGFNVTFRSVVKAWDDGMTVPAMRRLYDWNMQFNPREDIKGDMGVDARGSSVLMAREIQSQIFGSIVTNFTVHPILGKMIDPYPALQKFLQSQTIAADDVMVSRDDYDKALQQEAGQSPQPDPTATAIAKIAADSREAVAQIQRETALISLAEKRNMTIDQLTTELKKAQLVLDSKERIFAAELGAESRAAAEAYEHGDTPKGSGGYVSLGSEPTQAGANRDEGVL